MFTDDNPITPKNIAASETLQDVKLSEDGKKLLYHVKPSYKDGEHPTCAIWIADTDLSNSSRSLTSGLFNDVSGVFHPNGNSVLFLSDRHKAGDSAQLYIINLYGGEATPLIGKGNTKAISQFAVSPSGQFVAFTSADESSEEEKNRMEEKDDAKVFGDNKDSEKLRLFSFMTSGVRTLNTAPGRHVLKFTWKHDSTQILYCTTKYKGIEFEEDRIPLERISIAKGENEPILVKTYPRSPTDKILWISSFSNAGIIDIQSYETNHINDAMALYVNSSREYGDVEDVVSIVDLKRKGFFAVEVANGIKTRIDILDGIEYPFTLYESQDEALASWDAVRLSDGSFILAAFVSSASRQQPTNVWVAHSSSGEKVPFTILVSNHLQWVHPASSLSNGVIEWKAGDGTPLQGFVIKPANATGPLPTVLLVHGGPYGRDLPSYIFTFNKWHFLLASRGYLILSPNYRGSSGRGHTFAAAAHGGMGTVDWTDCESMLDEAIRLGLANPDKLGIGGWSQGGFMTAWGVTATKNRFRAAVMGAGVSDWGQLAAESDAPDFEADLGGSAPWTPGERKDFKGSPIRYVHGVETPVLIIHGEKDERVPVSQAISFMRGLRRESKYPERAQLIIYPRERHQFAERKHAEDVMKRVIEHFETWLPV